MPLSRMLCPFASRRLAWYVWLPCRLPCALPCARCMHTMMSCLPQTHWPTCVQPYAPSGVRCSSRGRCPPLWLRSLGSVRSRSSTTGDGSRCAHQQTALFVVPHSRPVVPCRPACSAPFFYSGPFLPGFRRSERRSATRQHACACASHVRAPRYLAGKRMSLLRKPTYVR